MTISRAMILSAGLGTRMRPRTLNTPKPMVVLQGKPLLGHHLDWARRAGVGEIVVNTHYLAEQIHAYLATRADMAIRISHETELLETGGGIKHALPLLGEAPFLAFNSDALCVDAQGALLSQIEQAWQPDKMDGLLVLVRKENARGYEGIGDFTFQDGVLARRGDAVSAPYVFSGVQILKPTIFDTAPDDAFSMNVIYNQLLGRGRLGATIFDGDWLHIGDESGLAEAEAYLMVRQ